MATKGKTYGCPRCAAPLEVPLGEVEVGCAYCGSRLKFVPEREELEVVRVREEMKAKERVAVQQLALKNRLQAEEAERWRQLAGKVAIAAVPVLGRSAGSTMFNLVWERTAGCLGCGCLVALAFVGMLAAVIWGLAN